MVVRDFVRDQTWRSICAHTRLKVVYFGFSQSSENSSKEHMEKWTELEEKCAKLINQTKELETR